jgi:hypothetical protein
MQRFLTTRPPGAQSLACQQAEGLIQPRRVIVQVLENNPDAL